MFLQTHTLKGPETHTRNHFGKIPINFHSMSAVTKQRIAFALRDPQNPIRARNLDQNLMMQISGKRDKRPTWQTHEHLRHQRVANAGAGRFQGSPEMFLEKCSRDPEEIPGKDTQVRHTERQRPKSTKEGASPLQQMKN